MPSGGAPFEEGPENDRTPGHPREMAGGGGGVFGRNNTAVAGTMSPAVFAGAVAPANLAGTDVPAVAEKEFSTVAEVCSSADDAEGSPSVICVSQQLQAVVEDIVTVPEPIEHSFDRKPSKENSSAVDIGTVPEPIEHSGVRGAVAPPPVGQWMEHSDDSGNWQHGRQSHTDNCNTSWRWDRGTGVLAGGWGG